MKDKAAQAEVPDQQIAAIKTVEAWAEAKGFIPQVLPSTDPNRKPAASLMVGSAAILGIAKRHNPKYWQFAAAKAANGWVEGQEVTESTFDEEIRKHTDLAHGA